MAATQNSPRSQEEIYQQAAYRFRNAAAGLAIITAIALAVLFIPFALKGQLAVIGLGVTLTIEGLAIGALLVATIVHHVLAKRREQSAPGALNEEDAKSAEISDEKERTQPLPLGKQHSTEPIEEFTAASPSLETPESASPPESRPLPPPPASSQATPPQGEGPARKTIKPFPSRKNDTVPPGKEYVPDKPMKPKDLEELTYLMRTPAEKCASVWNSAWLLVNRGDLEKRGHALHAHYSIFSVWENLIKSPELCRYTKILFEGNTTLYAQTREQFLPQLQKSMEEDSQYMSPEQWEELVTHTGIGRKALLQAVRSENWKACAQLFIDRARSNA